MISKLRQTTTARAVLLSLVLIVSAVAMPFAGTVAATHDGSGESHPEHTGTETSNDTATVWQGQTLKYTGASSGTEVTIRIDQGDNDGDFVKQYVADSDGNVYIDTGNLDLQGSYSIHANTNGDDTDDNLVGTFEVNVHEMSVATADDDSSVSNSQTGDNEVTFELDSNRATYSFYIQEADGDLTAQEIKSVFEADGVADGSLYDADNDGTDDSYKVDVSTSDGAKSVTANFQDVTSGDYTFEFHGTDSTAMASQQISVAQDEGAEANLNKSVYEGEQVGDHFEFTVDTESTDQFTVNFGDEETDGYTGSATVEVDDAESSSVTLLFDTYEAGGDTAQPFSLHEDSQNKATITSQTDDTDLQNPLEAADYDLSVSANGETKDVATVVLGDRSTDGASTHIAPSVTTLNDLDDIEETDNLSQLSNVAMEDKFVFKVEASGIYSYLDEDATAGDLQKAYSDDGDPNTFYEDHGIFVEVEEANPKVNSQPTKLDVSQATLITDPDNDSFYLVFDESDFADIEKDDKYEMTFGVSEYNAYVEDDETGDEMTNGETVTSTVTVVERKAEFQNMNDEDVVEVEQSEEAAIDATTTVAPGTEVTVLARSGSPNAFSKLQTVEVSSEKMISGTFNMSDANVDQEFYVQARSLTDRVDAVVVSGAPETYPVTINTADQEGQSVEADVSIDGQTVTTSGGSAEVSLQAGSYQLSATADGYEDVTQTVEVTEDGDNTVDVTMTAVPDTYTVTVTVEDEAGEAVSGANVSMNGTSKSTGSSGQAMFTVEDGSYTAQVSATDYQDGSADVTVSGSDTSATVTLAEAEPPEPETFEHEVMVVDGEGSPVEGATVSVGGTTKTTGAEGMATFTLESGSHSVTVEADGYQSYSDSLTVEGEGGSSELTLTAEQTNDDGGETDDGSDDDGSGGDSGGGIGMAGVVLIIAALVGGAAIIYYNRQNN